MSGLQKKSAQIVLGTGFLLGGIISAKAQAVHADAKTPKPHVSNAHQQQVTGHSHVVKAGDTLSQLAAQYHTSVSQLQQLNQLHGTMIYVGQHLQIHQSLNVQTKPTQHLVKAGDTLFELARQYHTSVSHLKALNHLNSDLILVGQHLRVHGHVTTEQPTKVVSFSASQTSNNNESNQSSSDPVTTSSSNNSNVSTSQNVSSPSSAQTTTNTATTNANSTVTSTQQSAPQTTSYVGQTSDAKTWIANRESGGNYNARNGQYVGKYQLSASYLHGDYSPANQEKVADQYVAARYGSWSNAQQFWASHGWY